MGRTSIFSYLFLDIHVFCTTFAVEMNRQGKRIGIAWLLLSVFVSMQLLSGFHHHEVVANGAIDCMECTHHIHHSGHFTTAVEHLTECPLCQFLSLIYTAATTTVLVPLVISKQNRRFFPNGIISQKEPSVLYTRGPPSVI
jgi:hypothetical protein